MRRDARGTRSMALFEPGAICLSEVRCEWLLDFAFIDLDDAAAPWQRRRRGSRTTSAPAGGAIILDMGEVVFDGKSQEVLDNAALRQQYLAIYGHALPAWQSPGPTRAPRRPRSHIASWRRPKRCLTTTHSPIRPMKSTSTR